MASKFCRAPICGSFFMRENYEFELFFLCLIRFSRLRLTPSWSLVSRSFLTLFCETIGVYALCCWCLNFLALQETILPNRLSLTGVDYLRLSSRVWARGGQGVALLDLECRDETISRLKSGVRETSRTSDIFRQLKLRSSGWYALGL